MVVSSSTNETYYRRSGTLCSRLFLRYRMNVAFAVSALRQGQALSQPVSILTTNPFFLPALFPISGYRGRLVNLVYDLYPDALVAAGVLRRESWIASRLAAVTTRALKRCDLTVFIGRRVQEYVERTYGVPRRSAIIPVGASAQEFRNPPAALGMGSRTRVLYSGQLGRMHDVKAIKSLLEMPRLSGIDLMFHASGRPYEELRRGSGGGWAHFGESLGHDAWVVQMKSAQVSLVAIAQGAENVVVPSKLFSALVAGHAIVAIAPRNSDLAEIVVKHDCGWVVSPGDGAGLYRVLAEEVSCPLQLQRKRLNAFRVGHLEYSSDAVAKLWDQELQLLVSKQDTRGCVL